MFGELVAARRHRLGLTQQELARRADLSMRTIRDLE
jgi:transcriptional regulator with XRE-family HTH domain